MIERTPSTAVAARASLLALTLGILFVVAVVPLLIDLSRMDNTYYVPVQRGQRGAGVLECAGNGGRGR